MNVDKLWDWVRCPECDSVFVSITRNMADRGGTESITMQCDTCGAEERFYP